MSTEPKPETLVLRAGPRSDSGTGAVAVPICQTTSYQFRSADHAASQFALREFGKHLFTDHEPDLRRVDRSSAHSQTFSPFRRLPMRH